MAALSAAHVEALRQLARQLGDLPWALGGSAMLAVCGIDVAVNDLDVMADAGSASDVHAAFPDFARIGRGPGPAHSAWLLSGRLGDVDVDVIGDMAVRGADGIEVFGLRVARTVVVDGVEIPLAPLEQWQRIYLVLEPVKAQLIAAHLEREQR